METDYYAVLGVEPENTGEAASGENESGVAEPIKDGITGSPQALVLEGEKEAPPEKLNFSDRKVMRNGARADAQNAEGRMQNDESAVETAEGVESAEGMEGERNEEELPQSAEPTAPSEREPIGEEDERDNPSASSSHLPLHKGGAEGKGQSAEENAKYAAARRKAEAERDAAVARVQEEAKQYAENAVAEVLKTAGFTNPYTGRPVRTKAEFDAYAARLSEEQKNAVLQGSGMTEEQFAAFMETQPEVQKAREAQKKAEAVIREAREREAKAKIDEQLKEITALNPAITSLADLTKLESYPALYEKVKKGYSIADAYKLTNMGDIESRAVARAQQQTRNAERTKAHLKSTESRGTGSVEVPADVKAEYRMMNPDATDAEIQRHYASYAKK